MTMNINIPNNVLIIKRWSLTVADCLVSIPGYQRPFRRDRQRRRGGGVAIYCADHISARRRHDLEDDYNE